MNIVGIIAEYNPMHNGHVYHIKKAKELANADYCIVIMSGSFTEQGNVAILDKFIRAKIAIENGADLVLELPTIHATSSAEGFARGAINILNSLGCITHLAFGAECEDINTLKQIANTCIQNEQNIVNKTKEYLKHGITSAQARDLALKELLNDNCYTELNKPNNILGIEYLKALSALNSQIEPVLIHRQTSSHNELKISNKCEYASSTAIREALSDHTILLGDCLKKIINIIPENTLNELKKDCYKTNAFYWNTLKYEILKLGKDGLKNIAEVNEGLENRIYDAATSASSYAEYISKVKSKRYTLSRLKRISVYIILGITKDLRNILKDINYCRVLKVNKNCSELLSILATTAKTTVITKLTNATINSLEPTLAKSLELDVFANNIVGNVAEDYTNNIIA